MKIIENRGHLGIDNIVSLMSYKPRINDVKYAIYSLLNRAITFCSRTKMLS